MIRGVGGFRCKLLLCTILMGVATIAEAAPRRGRNLVVLVPSRGDGKVTKAQLDNIDRALTNGVTGRGDIVPAKNLDKRSRPFGSTAVACRGDSSCLTKLIRSTKADTVLLPMARADGGKTQVEVTIASSSDVKVLSFAFASTTELNNTVAANSAALYSGGPLAAPVAAAPTNEPALEGLADLPLEPLDTTPPPVAKNEPPKPSPTATQTTQVVVEPPIEAPPGLESPSDNAVRASVASPARYTWKTWVGAGALVVGAAALTYGIIEYSHHKSIVNDANNDPSLTQRDAAARDDEASSAYNKSRIGIYAGIPLAVVGAGLLTWDLALGGNKNQSAKTDGAHLRLGAAPSPTGFAGSAILTW